MILETVAFDPPGIAKGGVVDLANDACELHKADIWEISLQLLLCLNLKPCLLVNSILHKQSWCP